MKISSIFDLEKGLLLPYLPHQIELGSSNSVCRLSRDSGWKFWLFRLFSFIVPPHSLKKVSFDRFSLLFEFIPRITPLQIAQRNWNLVCVSDMLFGGLDFSVSLHPLTAALMCFFEPFFPQTLKSFTLLYIDQNRSDLVYQFSLATD